MQVTDANGDSLMFVRPARLVPITRNHSGDFVIQARGESLVVPFAANMDSVLGHWRPMYPSLYLHGRPGDPNARRLEPRSPTESVAVDLLRWLATSPGVDPPDTATVASIAREVELWRERRLFPR